jgi:hypothetical protein
MSAVLDTIVDLADPEQAATELLRLNNRLAGSRTIPRDVAEAVRDVAEAVERTDVARWDAIDPRHTVLVLRAAVSAQRAIVEPRAPGARDRLRLALDSLGQALAAIAELQAVADERQPKEVVQFLTAQSEVPQARLARLLGVSLRQFQRWLSPQEAAQPEGDDLRKVRAVARVVNQLRFVLTPAGVVEWFSWPRTELGGRAPRELLDDPEQLPELVRLAAQMRTSYST